jgi:exodeoxyribonuclease VIII
MTDKYFTGAVADMPNATYHQAPHIGSGGFKLLDKSPAHYWSAYVDPARQRKDPTRLMLMGTAWHTGIFEPHLFAGEYAAKPDISAASTVAKLLDEALADFDAFTAKYIGIPDGISKTSKEGKALLADLAADGKTGIEQAKLAEVLELVPNLLGKTLLNADDLQDVRSMSEAARRHPVTGVIMGLPGGHAEMSIFWVDPDTGAPCRIRPDYHVEPCAMFPNGLIIDGKSNDDSSPEGFARSAWNSEMYFQAAFYSDGFQQHYRTKEPPVFAWLSQERDAPYATAYYSAGADFVHYGRKKYQRLLRTFAHCLQTGVWPGYPTTVQPLELPGWALKAIEGEVAA